jgi:hypothetical protein
MEAEEGGWDILITMAKGGGSDKRAACELLAAYAYGKPKQGVELTGADGRAMMFARVGGMTDDELKALVAGKDAESG